MKSYEKSEFIEAGWVGVDSGQIMVGDPCYIGDNWDSEWNENEVKAGKRVPDNRRMNYSGACAASLSPNMYGSIGGSLAFCTSSGFGDGLYPVYVKKENGRVAAILIDFFPEYDDDDDFIIPDDDGNEKE